MSDPDPTAFLSSALSERTERQRRYLLLVSMFGFLMSQAGLIPTEIAMLGVTFPPIAQDKLTIIAAVVIAYFAAGFTVYALPDIYAAWIRYHQYRKHELQFMHDWSEEDQRHHDDTAHLLPAIGWLYQSSHWIGSLRFAFDFVVPLIVGVAAILLLACHVAPAS